MANGPVTRTIGGTTSTAFDRLVQAANQDAEQRQQEYDEEVDGLRRIAEAPTDETWRTAAEENRGVLLNGAEVSEGQNRPVAIIQYIDKNGNECFCQADVLEQPDGTGKIERILQVVCPRCVANGVGVKNAQLTIRDTNRRWSLDEKMKGQVWVDPVDHETYVLAGVVEMEEKARCGQAFCGLEFRISSKSEYPGVSKLYIER